MSELPDQRFPVFDVALLRGDAGDVASQNKEWERVFGHLQPRLLSYFARRSEGILTLDDLLQEIWLRAFLNVDSLSSAAALWTWLVTIGTNLLRDELRRKRPPVDPLLSGDGKDAYNIAEYIGAASPSHGEPSSDTIDEIRSKLTENEWEFLNLLCVDNLTHEEVARRLQLKSAMASRQRLRRIRERLVETQR